jgi:hypothetical protein
MISAVESHVAGTNLISQVEEIFSPSGKEFYQRLRAAGKPAKVALTAVMRKLTVLMNHILKYPNFALQN